MAYTKTKATSGKGFALNINTGTPSSPTWTPVGESFDFSIKGKMDTDEATNYASTAKEFISTIFDGGEYPFSANRISTDAGQAAVQTAFLAGTLSEFQAVAPFEGAQVSTGDTWVFYAIVTEFTPAFKPDKKNVMTGMLRTSNGFTYSEGA